MHNTVVKAALEATPRAPWPAAARLVARWLERRERLDALLETLPSALVGTERARCQHLVVGVVRNFGRIDAALGRLVNHPPRFATRAILYIVGFELIESVDAPLADGKAAKVVHHAVEQTKALASPAESRLVNAVARKLIPEMARPAPAAGAPAAALAEYYSHPEWLVKRWLTQFGVESAEAFLRWNQQPPVTYARWRKPGVAVPGWMTPTPWPDFYEVAGGHWSDVNQALTRGDIYLQDPSTRLPVELLAPARGESILDLCAAPGGKSVLIADTLLSARENETNKEASIYGRLVAMDLPTARLDRLKENLSRVDGIEVALVQGDLLEGDPGRLLREEHHLPDSYAAVLLDAPCSNTGVIRHRPDVKWRLQEGDFAKHPKQQLALLHAASRLVAPGGRLVYSTCSVDADENRGVIKAFFESRAGSPFTAEKDIVSLPWASGHDGAAAFLLRRQP